MNIHELRLLLNKGHHFFLAKRSLLQLNYTNYNGDRSIDFIAYVTFFDHNNRFDDIENNLFWGTFLRIEPHSFFPEIAFNERLNELIVFIKTPDLSYQNMASFSRNLWQFVTPIELDQEYDEYTHERFLLRYPETFLIKNLNRRISTNEVLLNPVLFNDIIQTSFGKIKIKLPHPKLNIYSPVVDDIYNDLNSTDLDISPLERYANNFKTYFEGEKINQIAVCNPEYLSISEQFRNVKKVLKKIFKKDF